MKARDGSNRTARVAILAMAWLVVAGCTGSPQPRPDAPPATTSERSNAAGPSAALLTQSRAQRASGSNAQARATIERALAIDSNNAALWVELGEIELAAGRIAEAATMARKALTLAPRDSSTVADANALLERARR